MTYRDWVARLAKGISYLSGRYGPWGERFAGIVLGLTADVIAEGASQAATIFWLSKSGGVPSDALALLGAEMLLERYPVETDEQYRARLLTAWTLHSRSGTEQSIVEHLTAAGFLDTSLDVDPYHNQFAVLFPHGYPLVAGPREWDSFNWPQDGEEPVLWDCVASSAAELDLIRSIVRKRKPAIRLCSTLTFTVGGSPIYIPF